MLFTTYLKNIFKRKPKPPRKTGYYWVQFSYGGTRKWRVAWYNEMLEYWHIDGDSRVFYDDDFLKISNRQIPQNWLVGNPSRIWLYILVALLVICWASCILDVIYYINHITK